MKLNDLRPNAGGGSKPKKRGLVEVSVLVLVKLLVKDIKVKMQDQAVEVRPGFEGGQMPLFRRIPKRGFTNIFAKEYAIVNIEELNRFEENTVVTPELLFSEGIVKKGKAKDGVKILGDGEISIKLTVQAQKI